MNWTILGIEPTDDKEIINEAYRSRLRTTNPEDHPEEFKALRAAYEEALRLAEQPGTEPEKDESPVGLWMERVKELYQFFPDRIDPEAWRELLRDEVCIALDLRHQAEEALFRFLMGHWFLPKEIWQLLVEEFEIRERFDEFCQAYSRDFVQHAVLNGADGTEALPCHLFYPGLDGAACDRYRDLYNQAANAEGEEIRGLLDQLEALPESHPYGQAMRYQNMLEDCRDQETQAVQQAEDLSARKKEALAGLKALAEEYPREPVPVMIWCRCCWDEGMYDEAEELAQQVLELDPSYLFCRNILAECIYRRGDIQTAKDMMFRLMDEYSTGHPAQDSIHRRIQDWNEERISQLEAEEEKGTRQWTELAWCYLQNDREQEAMEICGRLDPADFPEDRSLLAEPEEPDRYDYHNLVGKVNLACEQMEAAREHIHAITRYLAELEDDGSEVIRRRLSRRGDFLQLESDCLLAMDREDECVEVLEQVTELTPQDGAPLLRLGYIFYKKNHFNQALSYVDRALELDPGSPPAHYTRSLTLYELHRDREAFEEINTALEIDGSRLEFYTMKLDILIRNEAWEPAHQVMDMLRQAGLGENLMVNWYEARLTEEEEKDEERALARYLALADRREAGEMMEHPADLYYNIAWLEGRRLDASREEDRDRLMEILEKGLTADPQHQDCLSYKAWLLKKGDKIPEALEVYHQLESYPEHGRGVERGLAECYYTDLNRWADKALHYYQMLLQWNPEDDVVCFYVGTCCRYLGQFRLGEKVFLREQELAPDDVDGYRGLSYIYEYSRDYERALEQTEKMLERTEDAGRLAGLHYRRHRLFLRLNRPADAIRALDECDALDQAYRIYPAKFDVYTNFRMWPEVTALMKEWKKSNIDGKKYYDCLIRLEMMQNHWSQAKRLHVMYRRSMDPEDHRNRRKDFLEADNDWKGYLTEVMKELPNSSDRDNTILHIAIAHAHLGNEAEARKYAEEALAAEMDMAKSRKYSEPLWRCRAAMALAICGRLPEAREQLSLAREGHLCESCIESRCKDADIFEILIESLYGDREKAIRIARAGRERFPAELDFLIALKKFEKKGWITL